MYKLYGKLKFVILIVCRGGKGIKGIIGRVFIN